MLSLGSLAFLNPWVLAALAALPILWWLLRAIPPSPRTQVFAGVRLLLGLDDEERQTHTTPWWLLLLRCLAVAAALIGFAQPVLNLNARIAGGSGTLLILMDQGWASAPDWADRTAAVRALLEEADDAGRDVILWRAAEADEPPVVSAKIAQATLGSTLPRPWEPDHVAVLASLKERAGEIGDLGETVWLHDGLRRDGTDDLLDHLSGAGALRLIGPGQTAHALTPPRIEDGGLVVDVLRAGGAIEAVSVIAMAEAEGGGERRIAVERAEFGADAVRETVRFNLPPELQNTVTRVVMLDRPSAGGAAFADGSIRRITAGLVATVADTAVTTLVSPTHYIEKALVPWADVSRGDIGAVLDAGSSAVVLVDHGEMADQERGRLTEWVENGGLLIRFAGPRLAASIGASGLRSGATASEDPLLPVRLRRGGRVLGGALAWSTPRALGPFAQQSPFRGLALPDEVDVRTQVLAEPSPDLQGKVWASLDDGTPLVTAKRLGEGRVVLFHISSDAEWSSLPLSGLFVEMLGRLVTLAPGHTASEPDPAELADTIWRPELLMGPNGQPEQVSALSQSVAGEDLLTLSPGPDLPPGIYSRADGSQHGNESARSLVINLTAEDAELSPFPSPPVGALVETLGGEAPVRYGPWLLALALILAAIDVLGTLFVSGRLGSRTAQTVVVLLAVTLFAQPEARAQTEADVSPEAVPATAETTLGYVLTGDDRIDNISHRGMVGLGNALARRTAIEPGPPIGIDPGIDDASFYPVLYWPLTAGTLPNSAQLDGLSDYIRGGGLLLIDTQNGSSGFSGASAAQMREIARAMNLPPLAPVDQDHVLTRTFYLLSAFPGRWRGARVWAEAPPLREDGTPEAADIPQFDRIDDNVSPVLVGSADWAAAWATDDRGFPMFPIGRPGDRQREMAIRFGINAVMYALTGNYKSDQVHAPAVLERLGQ